MASATPNNSSSSPSSPSSSPMSHRHMTENHGSSPMQSCRPSRQISSPWNQIVRGEPEPITASPSSPHKTPIDQIPSTSVTSPASVSMVETAAAADEKLEESGGQGNAGKKPVWKRPSNGASEVGPVMGASSWPALSEATKAPPSNKSSSDSLKSLDVPSSSVSVSQVPAIASVPSPKHVGRTHPNPTPNHSRQKSFNKRNGASGSANGNVSQPSAQGSFAELPLHNPSPRGQNQNQKNGFPSHNHGVGSADNPSQRDWHRNQNGNHHQSHGGRRNQEHGNQNWNFNRSFNGRDGNVQSQRGGAPAFVRHAPPPVQPIPPPFMAAQPFGSPVPFPPELASPYYSRMPFIAPLGPAPLFYHVPDLPLSVKLQKQIHYYFSEENLITDIYLRGFMDDYGFVPLRVIAGFKKVAELTDSIQQIVEALQSSLFVEVQGERIRKRHNWQNWLLPKARTPPAVSNPQSVEKAADAVTSRVGNLSIDQSSTAPIGGGSSSGQSQPAESENKAGSDAAGEPESSDGTNR